MVACRINNGTLKSFVSLRISIISSLYYATCKVKTCYSTGQGSARLGSDWDEFRRTFIILADGNDHRLIRIKDRTLDVVFLRFRGFSFTITRQMVKGVTRSRRRTGSLSVL